MVRRLAQQVKTIKSTFSTYLLLKATFLSSGSLVCGCYIAVLAVFEGIFTLKDRANKPRDCSQPFICWLAWQSVRTRLSKSEREPFATDYIVWRSASQAIISANASEMEFSGSGNCFACVFGPPCNSSSALQIDEIVAFLWIKSPLPRLTPGLCFSFKALDVANSIGSSLASSFHPDSEWFSVRWHIEHILQVALGVVFPLCTNFVVLDSVVSCLSSFLWLEGLCL